MRRRVYGPFLLLAISLFLEGCATTPTPQVHHSLKEAPGSRTFEQVVLLPVDIDVYEMSAGGVVEEVPEWSKAAEENIRSAVLVSKNASGKSCVSRTVNSSELTGGEREILEEHLALFSVVGGFALWAGLPDNKAWHFKSERFDYTLGSGLGFLKTKYGIDAGLIIVGEDVVATAGRTAAFLVGAALGVGLPMGHTSLIGGLVDFETGDLLWINRSVSGGGTDLRDPESCLLFAKGLMEGYPGFEGTSAGDPGAGD
jgi:hypothetical protein